MLGVHIDLLFLSIFMLRNCFVLYALFLRSQYSSKKFKQTRQKNLYDIGYETRIFWPVVGCEQNWPIVANCNCTASTTNWILILKCTFGGGKKNATIICEDGLKTQS